MRSRGHVYYGAEFLALCAAVRARGEYVRRVDVVGNAGWRVRAKDILPKAVEGRGTKVEGQPAARRCAGSVAQLWFDLLAAV